MNDPGTYNSPFASPAAMRIVLWTLACEPVFLAAIALVLKQQSAVPPVAADAVRILLPVFAAVSLGMLYFSYSFASGKYDPGRGPANAPPRMRMPAGAGLRIVAVALAIGPGVFGLVLHLLTGDDWALLAFNGTALAVAVRHVLAFNAADGGQS
jgi:hypothetical protein